MIVREICNAEDIPVPHEVIVFSRGRGGGNNFRANITEQTLDPQRPGYQLNAIGTDPVTGKRISLAPTTTVELARPVVLVK